MARNLKKEVAPDMDANLWDRLKHLRHSVIKRCHYECSDAFRHYGGRGIYVCDEWRNDNVAFYRWAIANGFRDGVEIDRIDNDGPYSPDNCRFICIAGNCLNRRNASKLGPGVFISGGSIQANIRINGKRRYLGSFRSAEEAAAAYRKAYREHYGEECPV